MVSDRPGPWTVGYSSLRILIEGTDSDWRVNCSKRHTLHFVWQRLRLIRLKFCSMRYFVGFYSLLLQSILMKLNLFNADFFRQHNLWIWSDHIFWILDIIFGRFRFSGYGPVFNDDLMCIFIRLLTFFILWQEWHKQTSEINCDRCTEFTNWFLTMHTEISKV